MINKLLLILCCLLAVSCSTNDPYNENSYRFGTAISASNTIAIGSVVFDEPKTPIYIEVFYPRDQKLNADISINQPTIILITALEEATSLAIIANDDTTNLNQKISVNFAGNLGEYLKYLSRLTNYHIYLKNNTIVVQSIIEKSWNLAGISSDSSNAVKSDLVQATQAQAWQATIDTVKRMLQGSDSKNDNVIVSANQKTGTLYVLAPPQKINVVDNYINNLLKASQKQIHLSVSVIDVSLENAKGRGIDWSLVAEGVNGAIGIASNQTQIIDGAGLVSIGTLNNSNLLQKGDVSAKVLISLLEKQGKVIVQNQPNITVLNGDTGIISTGTEFSYISKINANSDQNGNIVSTAEVERLNIGVDMQVRAKILDGDRVLINVVPIISSLQSLDTIQSGDSSFQTPNITLQKLSTQAIVGNGKTMHLGGLIAKKIANASKSVPGDSLFDGIFGSSQNSLEKREVVILIKPTIIN